MRKYSAMSLLVVAMLASCSLVHGGEEEAMAAWEAAEFAALNYQMQKTQAIYENNYSLDTLTSAQAARPDCEDQTYLDMGDDNLADGHDDMNAGTLEYASGGPFAALGESWLAAGNTYLANEDWDAAVGEFEGAEAFFDIATPFYAAAETLYMSGGMSYELGWFDYLMGADDMMP